MLSYILQLQMRTLTLKEYLPLKLKAAIRFCIWNTGSILCAILCPHQNISDLNDDFKFFFGYNFVHLQKMPEDHDLPTTSQEIQFNILWTRWQQQSKTIF